MHPLKSLREAVAISQERLARDLDVSLGLVSRVEQGNYSGSAWTLIDRLADHFGLTLDQARALVSGTIENHELRTILEGLRGENHEHKKIQQPEGLAAAGASEAAERHCKEGSNESRPSIKGGTRASTATVGVRALDGRVSNQDGSGVRAPGRRRA